MVARNPIFACALSAFVYLSVLNVYAKPPTHGIASWYGAECAGRRTASGEIFSPEGFTCASWHYPFQSILRVSTIRGKSVVVRVNDRGPNRRLHRIIDLSEASFAALADTKRGLIPVTIEQIWP